MYFGTLVYTKAYYGWLYNTLQKVHHLHIDDLYTDLRDGKPLLQLLETVSGEKIPYRSRKSMRGSEMFEGLGRIQLALDFLRKQNVSSEVYPLNTQQLDSYIKSLVAGSYICIRHF